MKKIQIGLSYYKKKTSLDQKNKQKKTNPVYWPSKACDLLYFAFKPSKICAKLVNTSSFWVKQVFQIDKYNVTRADGVANSFSQKLISCNLSHQITI